MSDSSADAVDRYLDLRELLDGFKQATCAECGKKRWFKEWDGEWRCQECGREEVNTVEYPCPECGTRMLGDGDEWTCQVCGEVEPRDTEELIDRLTGKHEVAGYARSDWQECPVCGESSILSGPDGEVACDECEEFYAYRFGDEWYAYAVWKKNPMRVRVTTEVRGSE